LSWNLEKFPVPDRHLASILFGAMGSHQGWDAILQYGYTAGPPKKKGRAFNYAMYNDPAFLGLMPAAALMYRAGHVQGAKRHYLLALDKSDFFYKTISPETSSAIRTISEKGKLQIALPEIEELPWLKATRIEGDSILIRDPDFSVVESDATFVVSDTGELTRDWERGIYIVDTPKTKAASGWIGGEVIKLGDIEFAIETRSASVAFQALDDVPLGDSKNIMISLAAQAMPVKKFRAPILAEPVIGVIKFKAPSGLKLFKKNSVARYQEVHMDYTDGIYYIKLTSDLRTYWLFLKDSSPEILS
jgi:hypothetical protein